MAFTWESRPQGVSWVDRLTAPQAVAQCMQWGLTPASTLEENRGILKNHIRAAQSLNRVDDEMESSTAPAQLHEDSSVQRSENLAVGLTSPQADQPEIAHPLGSGRVEPGVTSNPVAVSQMGDWIAVVQATAAAVGQSIAAAMTMRHQNRDTPSPQPQQRIPRAVYNMVAALPTSSGADSRNFLKFLIGTNQIFELNLVEEKQALIAVLPKTSGQLRTLWASAIKNAQSYSQLYGGMLAVFLPERVRQQLISDAVYRVQRFNEPLIDFITSVQDTAKILLSPEADLLDIVLTGMNAPTRARLAGFPAPATMDQLLCLLPRLEVIRNIERTPVQNSDHQGRSRQFAANSGNGGRFQAPFRPNTYQYGANRPSYQGNYRDQHLQPRQSTQQQSARQQTPIYSRDYNRSGDRRDYNSSGGNGDYNRSGQNRSYNRNGDSRSYNRNGDSRSYNRNGDSRDSNRSTNSQSYNRTDGNRNGDSSQPNKSNSGRGR